MALGAPELSKFTTKLKEELKIFNNFSVILDKSIGDGYIKEIVETIGNALDKETRFALEGQLTRNKKDKGKKVEPEQ